MTLVKATRSGTPSIVFGTLIVIIGVAFALVALLPWSMPMRPGSDLDFSHQQVDHLAWRTGLQIGSDMIFTKGPWGFALASFHPDTYFADLLAWLLLVGAMTLAMFCVALRMFEPSRRIHRSTTWTLANSTSVWVAALLWVVMLVVACAMRRPRIVEMGSPLLLAMSAPWGDEPLPRSSARSRANAIVRHLLVASMALGALIKFTFFATAMVAVLIVALDDMVRLRRFPWIAVTYLASLAFFWRIAGQPWDVVVPYLRSQIEITRGYAGAMGLDSPNVASDMIGFVLPGGLTLMLVLATGWRRSGWRGAIVPIGLGSVMFIIFKAAYVRHASHFSAGLNSILISLAAIWLPWIWREWSSPARKAVRVACVLLAGTSVASVSLLHRTDSAASFGARIADTVAELPLHMRRALAPGQAWRDLRTQYEVQISQIKRRTPLPVLRGTVDVYSFRQSVIVAHDLPYAPRPVFQSYAAYTPALARLNADHLLTRRAAETILFDVLTIDGRYPSLDDGLSWPRLLALYDVQQVTKDFVVLHRSTAPRATRLEPVSTLTGELDRPLELPAGNDLLWAEIDLEPTLIGRGLAMLYKPPLVTIVVEIPGRPPRRFRLVPDLARAGFLLSPLVETRDAWRSLADGTWSFELSGDRPTSIAFSAGEHQSTLYRDRIDVRLFRLVIERQ